MKDIRITVTDEELKVIPEEKAEERGVTSSEEPDQYTGTPVLADFAIGEGTIDNLIFHNLESLCDSVSSDEINSVIIETMSVVFNSFLESMYNSLNQLNYTVDVNLDYVLDQKKGNNEYETLAA